MTEITPSLGLSAYILGRRIAGQRQKKSDSVAYLYNGVKLPKLPEWDMVKYPYAYIVYSHLAMSYRIYTSNKAAVYDKSIFRLIFSQSEDVEGLQYNYYVDRPWVYIGTHDHSVLSTVVNEPIWANIDILNADGTIYIAASEPIPVYE